MSRVLGRVATVAVLAGLTACAWAAVGMSLDDLDRVAQLSDWLARFHPPSLALDRSTWWALFETLAIAWLATAFGLVFALPLSLLASRTLTPPAVTQPTKALLAVIRSVPSLIWALLFVAIVGLGPRAGVLALAFYTVGYLGKMFSETFEGLPVDPLEAHRAMGSGWPATVRHVVLPSAANGVVSQTVYMLEYNFRHSTVLGVVGAGGVGQVLRNHIEFLEYDRFFAVFLLVVVVVLTLDLASGRIRRRFQDERA